MLPANISLYLFSFWKQNFYYARIYFRETDQICGIKQKSNGPKINDNFTRKTKLAFRELRLSKNFTRI